VTRIIDFTKLPVAGGHLLLDTMLDVYQTSYPTLITADHVAHVG
jgi:hypothetical protein